MNHYKYQFLNLLQKTLHHLWLLEMVVMFVLSIYQHLDLDSELFKGPQLLIANAIGIKNNNNFFIT